MVGIGASPEKSSGSRFPSLPWVATSNDEAEDFEHDECVELPTDELGADEGSSEISDEESEVARLRKVLSISSVDTLNDLPTRHELSRNGLPDAMTLGFDALDRLEQAENDSLRLAGYSSSELSPSPEQRSSPKLRSQRPLISPYTERSGRGRSQSALHDQTGPFPQFEIDDLSPMDYPSNRNGQAAPSFDPFEQYSPTEFSRWQFSTWNRSGANPPIGRPIQHQRTWSNILRLPSVPSSPISFPSTARRPQYPRQLSDVIQSQTESLHGQARRHFLALRSNYYSYELAGDSGNPPFNNFPPQESVPHQWQTSGQPALVSPVDHRRGQSLSRATQSTDRPLRTQVNNGELKSSRRISQQLARLLSKFCQSQKHADSLSIGPPILDLSASNPRSEPISFVYTITLIPASFSLAKVIKLVDIFQQHAFYIPTLVTMNPGEPPQQHYGHFDTGWLADARDENLSNHMDAPPCKDGKGWPMGEVPTEIFQRIAEELSWDDLLNMRRVNHEFDMKVSGFIFKAVVVPFRRQIYSTKAHDVIVHKEDLKGKGKARHDPDDDQHLHMAKNGYYSNVKDKDMFNGMEVFNAWGPHVRKFAMSFEVNEDVLRHPPNKGRFETHNSFWGPFIWPSPHYARYAACENLEKKADEHQLMTTALSNLGGVFELALSVVSGLGWITGPDQSDRQKIFSNKPEVFGPRFSPSILKSRSRYRRWKTLTAHTDLRDALYRGTEDVDDRIPISNRKYPPLIFDGVDHESAIPDNYDIGSSHAITFGNLIPNSLTAAQQEWLLENNWAQEAFLTSWCMALIDNACTFKHVHTLKFARLSSRYLKMLERQDIWNALENLRNVTILLVPDWRDVVKTDDRIVDTPSILPSFAADQFFGFLDQWLVGAEKLTTLKVGYAAGGERAQGMCARNKHVLPAPVIKFSQPHRAVDLVEKVLTLPYIQHLTLSNCWIPPDMLKRFVFAHNTENTALRTLVLDSVSLTAWPGARSSDPVVPTRPVGIPVGITALDRAAITNPMLRNLSPVVQLQMMQDLQQSASGQNFGLGPDVPHDFLDCKERKGSWPDVINDITPGESLDQKRYLYGQVEDAPPERAPGSLRRINFISCGYVRLTKLRTLDQQTLGKVELTYINCLRQRSLDLGHVMMSTEDNFLGQIVPTIDLDEYMLLCSAFGMRSGWGDDDSKYENREDGQPDGGSGRFSGSLIRVEDDGREN